MYKYIKGKITEIAINYVVLENNNIGYKIHTNAINNYILEEQVTLYIYQVVREDDISLFGFKETKELDMFEKLIKVTGIGPKTAVTILGVVSIDELVTAIESENHTLLTKFPGIGPKTSKQIILDLKGKLKLTNEVVIDNDKISELEDALKTLGYTTKDFKKVVKNINKDNTIEEMIKESLKILIS